MTELPESWEVCTFADVTGPVEMVSSSGQDDCEINYIDISSIDNRRNRIADPKTLRMKDAPSRARQIVRSGDVLFSTVRPYLRNIAAVPYHLDGQIASTGFAVLRAADGVVPAYLFYKAISRDFVSALTGEQYGVSYPAVKEEQVRSQPFELPPTNEQHRIVAKIEALFSELDAGQDSLTRAQAQLKLYRQSLLKAAFQGRLTADWRKANADKLETPETLLSRIRREREARYKQALDDWQTALAEWRAGGEVGRKPAKPKRPADVLPIDPDEIAGLPPLPSGWVYCRFGEFIENITAGNSFACDEREPSPDEIGVAKVSAVSWGEYDEAESKTCRDPERVDPSLFIQEGDFLLSRANTIELVGASVIVRRVTKRVMLSDKTLRLTFDAGNQRYFLAYLRSLTGRSEIEKRSTGNQESMRNIGQDRIRSIIVPICSTAETEAVVSVLDHQLSGLAAIETEITTALAKLSALRQSILKKAFSGQLVPQDPSDEPASALLARLRDTTPTPRRKTKA